MGVWRDVIVAARAWRRAPGAAAVIVLTLAIGMGVTATAFTLAYAVLVRPLPFPNPDRLVWISTYDTRIAQRAPDEAGSNRMPQFLDWQEHARSFEQLAAWSGRSYDIFTISGEGTPERVSGLEITSRLLPMLGAQPILGRLFRDDEDLAGAASAVMISHRLWQRRFAGSPDVLGHSITIDNVPRAIVGVVSEEFPLERTLVVESPIDVYLPLILDPGRDIGFFMTVIGRLRPDVTPQQAQAELAERQRVIAASTPFMAQYAQAVTRLNGPVTRTARTPLLLLLGGVGSVLLMACGNLANLLLIRSSAQRHEMQLRAALGASGWRILRQTIAESGVLVVGGGALATLIVFALTRVLRGATWLEVPRLPDVSVGFVPLAFVAGICTCITIAFGCVPLLHLRHRDLMATLRSSSAILGGRRARSAQRAALVAQTAFALTLTVAGVLLFRSLVALLSVDPGFNPQGAIAMRVDPASRLRPPQRVPFFTEILKTVSEVPGVESAALAINIPMDRNMGWDVEVPGQPVQPGVNVASARIVSPGYFRVVGIPLDEGRDFALQDQLDTTLVVAINHTLARRLGPDPLGKTLVINGRPRQVIAVVGDVKHRTLDSDGGPEFYVSYAQTPGWQAFDLVVRTTGAPLSLVPDIRDAIWRVDPQQAVGTPVELQQLVDRTLIPQRLLSWLLSSFAAAALLLAAFGVYGIVSYAVAQRRKETAIRVALGSPRWRIESAAIGHALRYVAAGLIIGVPLAVGAGNAARSFLFGVAPDDVTTILASAVTVLSVATIASYVPARRAARVDAMSALRAE